MRKFLMIVTVLLLSGCTGASVGGGNSSSGGGTFNVVGSVQKGPFIQGTVVTIQALDSSLNPTGQIYMTETVDSLGNFVLPATLTSSHVQVIATGYYFNEVTGALSSSPLTLRTYADLSTGSTVRLNILTELVQRRLKALRTGGRTFATAEAQAQTEVLAAFGITESITTKFNQMDLSASGDGNAVLLAISCIMQGQNSVAQLSEFAAQISTDIASNGSITNSANQAALRANSMNLDMTQVAANLTARYAALGLSRTVPNFEDFVDSTGSGVINRNLPTNSIPSIAKIMDINVTGNGVNIAVDTDGNVFYADVNNGTIRKVSTTGHDTVFVNYGATGGYGNIAIDKQNNLYFSGLNRIFKITSAGASSTLVTFNDGTIARAMTIDPSGNIFYVESSTNYINLNVIKKVTPAGVVSTFAGSTTPGFVNATGTAARFNQPYALTTDSNGSVFVADLNNYVIRKITPAGVVSTFAGSGIQKMENGTGAGASFYLHNGLGIYMTTDESDNLYLTENANTSYYLRKISPSGVATTYCGNGSTTVHNAIGSCSRTSFFANMGLATRNGTFYYVAGRALLKVSPPAATP